MDEKIRINKYLSDAGVCSRREADRMIEQGRITVNGEKAVSGQKISLKDEICVDHVPVVKMKKKFCCFLINQEESYAVRKNSVRRQQ